MSDLDMNFSDSIYNIDSTIRKFGFPVVIKSMSPCDDKKSYKKDEIEDYYDNAQKLPYGSITMLEKKLTLQFAHVTVMEFRDPDKVQKEKGIEFIESHSEYEDEDYLLPLSYDGKCKIVHPSGRRKRYCDITELIKDLPRLILMVDKLVLVDPESEDVTVIPAGEILEIVDVKMVKTIRHLVCKDKTEKCIKISEESTPVNITAIADTEEYTIGQVANSMYLPKCIEFEDVSPYDIVIYDDFWANHLLVMSGGPFRVNATVEREVVLGWCIPIEPNGTVRPFRTVLIPKNKWKNQKVKVRNFKTNTERLQFIKKHFPGRSDSEYISNKFYLMDAETYPGIVWLQNRKPISQDTWHPRDSGRFRPLPLPVEREALPDSDLERDYEEPIPAVEPAPPVPPREVKLPTRIEKPDLWKEVLEKIQTKAKSGFDKVHFELQSLFWNKGDEDHPPPLYPRPTGKKPKARHHSERSQTKKSTETAKLKRHKSEDVASASKLKQNISVNKSLPESPKRADVKRSPSSASAESKPDEQGMYLTPVDEEDPYENSDEDPAVKRPQMPLPELPANSQPDGGTTWPDTDEDHKYDYPDVGELAKRGYIGIDVAEAERVFRTGQTAEDFYDYRIDEVVQCFKLLALQEVADVCDRENIDGQFFKKLSDDEIKNYFKLDTLHFIKIKKAIFDGWRPR